MSHRFTVIFEKEDEGGYHYQIVFAVKHSVR
jgi:hypothetical protein